MSAVVSPDDVVPGGEVGPLPDREERRGGTVDPRSATGVGVIGLTSGSCKTTPGREEVEDSELGPGATGLVRRNGVTRRTRNRPSLLHGPGDPVTLLVCSGVVRLVVRHRKVRDTGLLTVRVRQL